MALLVEGSPTCLVADIVTYASPYIRFFSMPGIAASCVALHQLQIPHPFLHNICQASCSPSHSYGLPFLGAGLMLVLIQSHPRFFSAWFSNLSCLPCTQTVLQHIWISSHHYTAHNLLKSNLYSSIPVIKGRIR